MTGFPCANCGRPWPTRASRASHEQRGHPGWSVPVDILRERATERWRRQDPARRREISRAYRERDPERARRHQLAYRQRHPERVALNEAKYRLGHREAMRQRSSAYRKTPEGRRRAFYIRQRQIADGKHSARMAVTRAIADGGLERQPCRICGDPRSQAHHHLGYDRRFWLVVDWLCTQHHNDAHHPEAARRRAQLSQVA